MKKIFKEWRYSLLALIIAVVFYGLNVIISNYKTIVIALNSQPLPDATIFFVTLYLGFWHTLKFHSFISLIIISLLIGTLFSLILFKTNSIKETKKSKLGVISSMGVFLGILAPGCAACGIGILSVLGIGTAFINLLPLEGLEISILSIIILGFANWKILNNIKKPEICKVNIKKI